jgi:hypothetical protein
MKKLLFSLLLVLLSSISFAVLSGQYSIPGSYATIADAVTALNSEGVTGGGGVTFNVAANHTESVTAQILITATGSSADQIIFQKIGAGANPIITRTDAGSNATSAFGGLGDAVIRLDGTDYITFDGIDIAASNAGIEYGYYTSKPSGTNGCQYVTIKNCTVTMTKGTSAFVIGIYISNGPTSVSVATGVAVTNVTGVNSNVVIASNTIQNVHSGIHVRGYSTVAYYDSDITVGQNGLPNIIQNYGGGSATAAYGVYFYYVNNPIASYNTINNGGGGGAAHTAALNGIYYSSISGNVNASNNNITMSSSSTSAVNWIYNTTTTTTETYNNNTFAAGALAATSSSYLIISNNSTLNKTISGNQTSGTINKTGASGNLYCYYNFGSPASGLETITNNTFSNITVAGTSILYGIYSFTAVGQNRVTSGNVMSNWTLGTGAAYGINVQSTTSNQFYNNTVNNISSGATIYALYFSGTSPSVYSNTAYGLTTTGGSVIYGLFMSSGTTANVFKNKIYDLTANNASGSVYGIHIAAGTTANVYNNLISNLYTPLANAANPLIGINVAGGTNSNIYYNTVYLNATSSGALFGSSAIYASTSPILDMRNNILVNVSTPNGATGFTTAYRRSTATLNTYANTSNNNLLYAGTPGTNNLLFYDTVTSKQTLVDYKAWMLPRDAASVTENPPILSFVGSNPGFLHINPAIQTRVESGAATIATIIDDYDGDLRTGAPDIGADEGVFTPILAPPLAPLYSTPADLATNVAVNEPLTWSANPDGGTPTSYVVYFGTTSPPDSLATVTATSYAPARLFNQTYFWKIKAINAQGNATGGERSFSTSNGVPSLTAPANLATMVTEAITFTWTAIPGVTYKIKIGITPGGTNVANMAPVATNSYTPSPVLNYNTLYYWSIYSVNGAQEIQSAEWNFTTRPDPRVTLPYTENFDGGAPNMVISPAASWVIGTPAKTFLNAAHSTPNAMVTRSLTAVYNASENMSATLEINTTPLIRDINVSFWQKFTTEAGWDAMVLEYSVDYQATWTKWDAVVGTGVNYNTPTSYFWYNSISTSGPVTQPKWSSLTTGSGSDVIYQDDVSGWINSSTRIPYSLFNAAGNLSLRWRFASDSSGQYEGFAIDDISISEASPNPVFSVSPTSKDFGLVEINSAVYQDFTVTNAGGGTLIVNSIGLAAPMYSLSNLPPLPASLTMGASFTLRVNYTPTTAGVHPGNLTITDSLNPTHNIGLTGTCFDPLIVSYPYTQNFDGVTTPNLPLDWKKITDLTGTVTTTTSTPVSAPNNVNLYNGATIASKAILVSPPNSVPLNQLRISFYARSSTAGHIVRIGSVDNTTPGGYFTELSTIALTTTNTLYTVELFSSTGIDDYIALKNGGSAAYSYVYIDNVTISQIFNNDMSAVSLTGPAYGVAGSVLNFTVTVRNDGLLPANSYDVNMKRIGDIMLASVHVDTPLAPGATAQHNIPWTPSLAGTYMIYGQAVLAGDETPANDNSPEILVYILEADNAILTIGDPASTTTANTLPLDFYYKNSVSETIYFWNEMHLVSGAITAIVYKNNFTTNLPNKPVKIWMGATNRTNLSAGWVAADSLTLVYDGTVSFPSGINTIIIPLQTPFTFTGGNIVVRANRPIDTSFFATTDVFYYTATPAYPNRSRYLVSDTVTYDPLAPSAAGTLLGNVPNTYLVVDNAVLAQEAVMEGYVTIAGSEPPTPIEGATVALTDERYSTTTDANGYYRFGFWENHTVSVNVSKATYYPSTMTNVNLVMGTTVTQNFSLFAMPRVTVSGRVNTNDHPIGLSGALITLSGPENYNTVADVGGIFSIPNVLGSSGGMGYTLTITLLGYQTHVSSRTVYATNLNLGFVTLYEPAYSPYDLVAAPAGADVQLNWTAAGPPPSFSYDFETTDGGFTATNSVLPGWEWGTSAYSGAHSGTKVWGTGLAGYYANGATYELVTPGMLVGNGYSLMFWHRYNFEGTSVFFDGGIVQISTDNGSTWSTITPVGGYPVVSGTYLGSIPIYGGTQTFWTLASFDLSGYNGQTVKLKWKAMTDLSVNSYYGWFIDDVFVGQPARFNAIDLTSARMDERSFQSYKVYRFAAADEGTPANWTLLAQNITGISYLDTGFGAVNAGTYKWAVKAVYSGGLESNAILSNPLVQNAFLAAPQDLVISRNGSDIQLDWTAVIGATTYKVYASDDPYNIEWILLGSTAAIQYVITAPVDNYKFYRVTAAN